MTPFLFGLIARLFVLPLAFDVTSKSTSIPRSEIWALPKFWVCAVDIEKIKTVAEEYLEHRYCLCKHYKPRGSLERTDLIDLYELSSL